MNEIFYALRCINNHVLSCLISMLSDTFVNRVILVVYVNDILITDHDSDMITCIKTLKMHLTIQDLGAPKYL